MMNAHVWPALLGLSTMLAGCAGQPLPTLHSTGSMPAPGNIQLVGDGSADASLNQALLASLASHGFPQGDHPVYLVQLTTSRLPGKTGLMAPEESANVPPTWLAPPSKSRAIGTRIATFSLSDQVTGRQLYQAVAAGSVRTKHPEADDRVRDALLAAIDRAMTPATDGQITLQEAERK